MSRRLVLVGGGAGTGKSSVARRVADALGASWTQLDTLWAVARDSAPTGSPGRDLLDLDAHLRRADEPPDRLVARHVAASAAVCRALPAALAIELDAHPTVIADGAWILPSWAAGLSLPGAEVAAVFLHEPEPERLDAALAARRAGPVHHWHVTSNRVASGYGEWLVEEATRFGLPVVQSRPWSTLLARVLDTVGPGGPQPSP